MKDLSTERSGIQGQKPGRKT
uniref:Uncharacterized protein n=1 Tax=Anguilla anguilla TaxID=7936 RepID=A0A0E9TE53_ANGAN